MKVFDVVCRVSLLAGVVFALAACAPRAHCKGEHAYLHAETVTPMQDTDGIRVPASSSALLIPEGPLEGPAYATEYEDERGRTRIRCLDTPPPLPELVEGEASEG